MSNELLTPHMRVFAIAVLLGFLAWVANLVRHRRLSLRDSLLWLLSTFAALMVTAFPQLLAWTARALQIAVPANALFVLTFLYVIVNLLSVTIAASTSSARVRRLTQECALLRAELQLLKEGKGLPGQPADAPGFDRDDPANRPAAGARR
jgi:hypothetical protein